MSKNKAENPSNNQERVGNSISVKLQTIVSEIKPNDIFQFPNPKKNHSDLIIARIIGVGFKGEDSIIQYQEIVENKKNEFLSSEKMETLIKLKIREVNNSHLIYSKVNNNITRLGTAGQKPFEKISPFTNR